MNTAYVLQFSPVSTIPSILHTYCSFPLSVPFHQYYIRTPVFPCQYHSISSAYLFGYHRRCVIRALTDAVVVKLLAYRNKRGRMISSRLMCFSPPRHRLQHQTDGSQAERGITDLISASSLLPATSHLTPGLLCLSRTNCFGGIHF